MALDFLQYEKPEFKCAWCAKTMTSDVYQVVFKDNTYNNSIYSKPKPVCSRCTFVYSEVLKATLVPV